MWFGLLGPLHVRHGNTTLVLSAGKHRSLLAALVASAGDVVSFDHLAEIVWDGAPPGGSRVALRRWRQRELERPFPAQAC